MLLLELLINGLIIGSIYALMAMSFSLVLTVTKVWHFAHAGVYTIGAYSLYLLISRGLPFWIALIITILIIAALGFLIEKFAYSPLRNRKSEGLIIFMAALILNTLIENVLALVFGTDQKTLISNKTFESIDVAGITITTREILVIVVCWGLIFGVLSVIKHTRWGQSLTAIATNAEMAENVGINSKKAYRLVLMLGSVLTVPAVTLIAIQTGISPSMGQNIIVIAVVATIMGGLNSIHGAAIAGLIIGVIENIGVWKLDSEWQSGIAFGILFLFIVLRPQGLFGGKLKSSGV